MKHITRFAVSLSPLFISACVTGSMADSPTYIRELSDTSIQQAFMGQSLTLGSSQLSKVRSTVTIAHQTWCENQGTGNSKVQFDSVQIAHTLALNPMVDGSTVDRVSAAIRSIPCVPQFGCRGGELRYSDCRHLAPPPIPRAAPQWSDYFAKTVGLGSRSEFLSLLSEKKFSPVKISWEDIGRYQGSAWGDRISDVGIWVRKEESDLQSAELALSVRRDSNFRDKVLVVPSSKIKIHLTSHGSIREVSLPDRLIELGLRSKEHDQNVIVSNQFSIVPVPAKEMMAQNRNDPPRAAFNFSIYPYGSTNYVITDVIEGSADAIVGQGGHQLLYSNVGGQKAPFTASRASDREDLVRLEASLKARGMDVDVQRYYLIQIPLRRDATDIQIANMGTPPFHELNTQLTYDKADMMAGAPAALESSDSKVAKTRGTRAENGLAKVAIGHGDIEGPYVTGSGFQGQRAEEPIRVTVVYFVTPVGEVTRADMDGFASAFESWDQKAIWGGSFVTKE